MGELIGERLEGVERRVVDFIYHKTIVVVGRVIQVLNVYGKEKEERGKRRKGEARRGREIIRGNDIRNLLLYGMIYIGIGCGRIEDIAYLPLVCSCSYCHGSRSVLAM